MSQPSDDINNELYAQVEDAMGDALEDNDVWEYRVEKYVSIPDDILEQSLNKFGMEGWELVSVHAYRYVFKRRTIPCYNCSCSEEESALCPMYIKYIASIEDKSEVTIQYTSCAGCDHAPEEEVLLSEFYCDKLRVNSTNQGCDLYEESDND